VRRKSPELWENQTWMFHHDYAIAHVSLLIRINLAKYRIFVVPNPSYSPNLPREDLFLLSKLKTTLKGRRFQTEGEFRKLLLNNCPPSQKVCSRKHYNKGRNFGNCISPVEGTTLTGTVLKLP